MLALGILQVARKTTKAVTASQYLANSSKVRSFLGLRNVCKKFVSTLAHSAAPLNKKLREDEPSHFALGTVNLKAVDALKNDWRHRCFLHYRNEMDSTPRRSMHATPKADLNWHKSKKTRHWNPQATGPARHARPKRVMIPPTMCFWHSNGL